MENTGTNVTPLFSDSFKGRFRFPEIHFMRPGKLRLLIALAALVIVFYNLFFVYIRPDEYGIKVVRVGLNRGVHKQVYHAGLNFIFPFGFQQMYRLPKGIQVLELTNFPQTAAAPREKIRRPTSNIRRFFCGCGRFHSLPDQGSLPGVHHHRAPETCLKTTALSPRPNRF